MSVAFSNSVNNFNLNLTLSEPHFFRFKFQKRKTFFRPIEYLSASITVGIGYFEGSFLNHSNWLNMTWALFNEARNEKSKRQVQNHTVVKTEKSMKVEIVVNSIFEGEK